MFISHLLEQEPTCPLYYLNFTQHPHLHPVPMHAGSTPAPTSFHMSHPVKNEIISNIHRSDVRFQLCLLWCQSPGATKRDSHEWRLWGYRQLIVYHSNKNVNWSLMCALTNPLLPVSTFPSGPSCRRIPWDLAVVGRECLLKLTFLPRQERSSYKRPWRKWSICSSLFV